ncbi:TNF receptor-associated factor 4-like [Dendronephthya gigantea]|uniref:TNF receptor-associated factor 4-like n=1 Tax=Dendronephthya gigantea TaxID=151771 RepID=UPI00106ADB26|nr:TNF receptor-associated factor 4-like [Dendronephthya gigantea]
MATNGHSGHPMKWFKDQNAARHAYECAICLEVLKDPVQIQDCGHQFCELCIQDILRSDPRCPSCRIDISYAKIFEDQAARRQIKQLHVNCCNEGCSWMGCLSSLLQDHQNSCNFLIGRADNAHQLDVWKLQRKLQILMLKVSTLEKKQEDDIKELTLKHENELKQLKSKHDEDLKALREEFLVSQSAQAAHAPQKVQKPLTPPEPEPAYTWKIANFTRKLLIARSDNQLGSLESEPFFSIHGYKMRLEVNLNEGPRNYVGFLGVYMGLLMSDRDGILPWPFTKRCSFVLVDQQDDVGKRQNIQKSFVPEGENNFKRPRQRANTGRGFPDFVLHTTLHTRQYIRDHAVYIKIIVDP